MYKEKFQEKTLYDDKAWQPNFELNPITDANVLEEEYADGYPAMVARLAGDVDRLLPRQGRAVLVVDCYLGVNQKELREELVDKLHASTIVDAESCLLPPATLDAKFERFINPSDRTYGVYAVAGVEDYFDPEKVAEARAAVEATEGLAVVYGIAASHIAKADILVYGNIIYTEVSARLRKGLPNWGADNGALEYLQKDKRGIFLDYPVLNCFKRPLLKAMDYMVSFDKAMAPLMITGQAFRREVLALSARPFKCVPIFMPAPWGGDWMQTVLDGDKTLPNLGWCLTGLIDMQAIQLTCGATTLSFPAQDLICVNPTEYLGNKIFYFWGYKCPLHVNFLDTWNGGNLSLQVHPTAAYSFDVFNSTYGHHESYYLMDAQPGTGVYLGLKEGAKVEEFVQALEEAQETGVMDDSKYVNKVPVKKHDHVFIPGGTVHSSGAGALVLEIDAFAFATFKLWDWGRMDMDGRPRAINIDHGRHCIQEKFQGDFVYDRLVSKQPEIARGYGWRKEDSSTMNYEPMTVNRYWLTDRVHLETNDNIIILVLVEGREALIESVDGSFAPITIHYAEAVFVPADTKKYLLRPTGNTPGEEVGILEIFYPM